MISAVRIMTRWLLTATIAAVAVTAPADAQTTTGSIRGYVRGPNNAPKRPLSTHACRQTPPGD